MLRDSTAEFSRRNRDMRRVREARGRHPGYDRAALKDFGALGWTSILIPERYGGLGLGFREMAIVCEVLGETLAPEPVIASSVLAARVICGSGNASAASEVLPQVCAGDHVTALAWQEANGVHDPQVVACRLQKHGAGLVLNGVKRFVHGGAAADSYVLTANFDEELALVLVPGGAEGARLEASRLADGCLLGELSLHNVSLRQDALLCTGLHARRTLRGSLDEAAVMVAAELCGVQRRALELTLEHLRTRRQFGRPIGSFQALQHKAVDVYLQLRLSEAVVEQAIGALDLPITSPVRSALASRAKARTSDAALLATRQAIQLHGAMGYTDEHDAGLYLKRALVRSAWLGSTAVHRKRFGEIAARAASLDEGMKDTPDDS